MNPERQTILVTGGSRGIGAATSRLAARRGYKVCVNFRSDVESAEKLVREIVNDGGQAIAVQADISVESEIVRLFEECDRQLGSLGGLVNNAGTLETQAQVDSIDVSRLTRVFATNVFGAFICGREAIRRMSKKRGGNGGAIVNVSSGASRLGSPGEYVDYAASKGALDTFTVGLAREVATEGIRVNAVRPGYIYTDMHSLGGEPDRVNRLKEGVPMKRGGQAEEVANAILWLLSDESSFVTGSIVDVTGGI